MPWTFEVSEAAERDLDLIFHHLAGSFGDFGMDRPAAAEQALGRVLSIRDNIDRLGVEPRRGEAHSDLLPGLRHLTIDKAVYWFVVDEVRKSIQVLAIFYGGQEHRRHMLRRLLQ